MHDIALFSIGFKAEYIHEGLRRYKVDSVPMSKRMLEDSLGLIDDCFAFQGSITSFFSSGKASLSEFLPLIFDLFPGKEPAGIVRELQAIKETVESIARGEKNVDVERTLDFFRTVSTLCLRRNAQMSTNLAPMHTLAV